MCFVEWVIRNTFTYGAVWVWLVWVLNLVVWFLWVCSCVGLTKLKPSSYIGEGVMTHLTQVNTMRLNASSNCFSSTCHKPKDALYNLNRYYGALTLLMEIWYTNILPFTSYINLTPDSSARRDFHTYDVIHSTCLCIKSFLLVLSALLCLHT